MEIPTWDEDRPEWETVTYLRRWWAETGENCRTFRFRNSLKRQFVVGGFVFSERGSDEERRLQRERLKGSKDDPRSAPGLAQERD